MGAGEQSADRKRRAELGRLLAAAAGYQALTATGGRLGRIEHVRYGQNAEWPDEIIVRSRWLLRTRRRVYALGAVSDVDPRSQTVVIVPTDCSEADVTGPDRHVAE
jgi:hypothetical protein